MNLKTVEELYWQKIIRPGDDVIDATLGNGYDTLRLAKIVRGKGKIYGFDIQKKAIENSQKLLRDYAIVEFYEKSHADFGNLTAKLIVYNLGYLPKGDKSVTTQADTTIKSLESAIKVLQPGGAITLMAYVGHPEGVEEERAVRQFCSQLPKEFLVVHHTVINREKAPHLYLIGKEADGIPLFLDA